MTWKCGQDRGCLTLDRGPTGWRLRADATIGIVVLNRVRLVIAPKFAVSGEHIMTWLAYALDAPTPLRTAARRWSTAPDGYADLVPSALLEQCERLLREGLRRDYVGRQGLEPVLSGRLDIAAQVSYRYGQLDRPHVHTLDRETNVWDNRALGTALRAALPLVTGPHLARQLRSGVLLPVDAKYKRYDRYGVSAGDDRSGARPRRCPPLQSSA